jgi:hypothetical protein
VKTAKRTELITEYPDILFIETREGLCLLYADCLVIRLHKKHLRDCIESLDQGELYNVGSARSFVLDSTFTLTYSEEAQRFCFRFGGQEYIISMRGRAGEKLHAWLIPLLEGRDYSVMVWKRQEEQLKRRRNVRSSMSVAWLMAALVIWRFPTYHPLSEIFSYFFAGLALTACLVMLSSTMRAQQYIEEGEDIFTYQKPRYNTCLREESLHGSFATKN